MSVDESEVDEEYDFIDKDVNFDDFQSEHLQKESEELRHVLKTTTYSDGPDHKYLQKDSLNKIITINISGKEFMTKFSNFARYPDSRLGQIYLSTSYDQMRTHCDGVIPGDNLVLFFQRNPQHFVNILGSYSVSKLS